MLRMQPVIDVILKKHKQALQNEAQELLAKITQKAESDIQFRQIEFKNQFNLNLINLKNQLQKILNDYLEQRKNYVFLEAKKKWYGVPQQDKSGKNSKSYQDYFSNKNSDIYSMEFYEKLSTMLSSISNYESSSSAVTAIDELLTAEAKYKSPTLYETVSQIKTIINKALYFSINHFDSKKSEELIKSKQDHKYEKIRLDIENYIKNKINEQYEIKLRTVENLQGYLNLIGQLQGSENSLSHFEKLINDFKYSTREDALYNLEEYQNPWSRGPVISQSEIDVEHAKYQNAECVAYASLNTRRDFAKAEVSKIHRDIVFFEAQFKISSELMKLSRLISSKNTIEEKLNILVGNEEYVNFIQILQSQLVRNFEVNLSYYSNNNLNLFKPVHAVCGGTRPGESHDAALVVSSYK